MLYGYIYLLIYQMYDIFYLVIYHICFIVSHGQKKTAGYFPLNPGWLFWGPL